ncbi:MFS transporter [Nocardia sp. BMG51109]|uniref:MFS transporter n=1 Tax=Nocardia sp. BMG51109 TaxID=1056816 RepID=UPI0004659C51|nr:MFS transporter [Nocardia sp. BMG51109]
MDATPVAPPTRAADARLDRIPVVTRSHRIWVALLGIFFTFDLVDLNTFAYVAPALRSEWGLSITAVGAVTSVSFLGMFLGGLLGGRLADRFGRRPTILGSAVFYSTFSLLSAVSVNVEMLAVTRVLTGFGLQAMTGVLLVYVTEMFPREQRGRYQSLTLALGLLGVPIAAAVSRLLVPIGPGTWRWVFVIGAGGIVGVILSVRLLPESIRWQVAQGRAEEAEPVLAKLESEARGILGRDLPEPGPAVETAESGNIRELLRPPYLQRLTVASAVMICLILGFYGFSSWIPTLLVEDGYTQTESLNYSLVLAIGAVPGALLAWPLVDRFERKTLILGISLVVTVLLLAFGISSGAVLVMVIGFLINMLMQMLVAVLYTYLPEVFPTRLRGLGAGCANSVGRLSGAAGAFIVGGVYSGLGYTAVFLYLALVILLLGTLLALFGERTTRRRLEDVGSAPEPA